MKVQTENKSYVRDINSKALLQKNTKELDEYKFKSKLLKQKKSSEEEINNMKQKISEIDDIKHDIAEIKNLLKGLTNR